MIRLFALCLVLMLALPASSAGLRIVDDAGVTLELAHAPRRIVAMTPHLTELLFAVGAGKQVVGVDSASDFPDEARHLPKVGDFSRINFERVVALKPDLVIVWLDGNRAADIHGLKQLGFSVLQTRATGIADVARLLRLVGKASGHAQRGETVAQAFQTRLESLRQPMSHTQPLEVFYQIWDRPLMTVGGRHWISDALTVCGAHNVFADLHALSPVVSREAVLQRAPSLIMSGSDSPQAFAQWRAFTQLPAVREGAFVRVDADLLHRPTPRLLDGVVKLCTAIKPYMR